MAKHSFDNFDLPDYDIEEVPNSSPDKAVIKAGEVETWKRLAPDDKARFYTASLVIAVWVVWMIVGLITYVCSKDKFLIESSPTSLIVLLLKILLEKDKDKRR